MKLSVSLSAEDLARLDRYVEQAGLESRSAAVQQAIRRLQDPEIEAAYASAWDEWRTSKENDAWDISSADGLADAAR